MGRLVFFWRNIVLFIFILIFALIFVLLHLFSPNILLFLGVPIKFIFSQIYLYATIILLPIPIIFLTLIFISLILSRLRDLNKGWVWGMPIIIGQLINCIQSVISSIHAVIYVITEEDMNISSSFNYSAYSTNVENFIASLNLPEFVISVFMFSLNNPIIIFDLISFIMMLCLLFWPGTKGKNKYGDIPQDTILGYRILQVSGQSATQET